MIRFLLLLALAGLTACSTPLAYTHPDVKKWEKVTLDFPGPTMSESGAQNPFTDYRLDVTFTNGEHRVTIPGFYAADGRAAYTGASAGDIWQVRFRPDREGEWTYSGELMRREKRVERYEGAFLVGPPVPGETGRLVRDHPRYLRWAETGDYHIKSGVDSPENLLAYADFDGTYRHSNDFRDGESKTEGLHVYAPHAADYRSGDPDWNGRGHNLIGGLNYLASAGVNSIYFLTLNINGDGKDVWPYVSHDTMDRFDVSKLDQWEIVFDHADSLGMMLHFVLNETENETLLDGGDTGPLRRLYFRELVARFGHHRAITWNLGEENGPTAWTETSQTTDQQRSVIDWFADHDPFAHHVVLHTHPNDKEAREILDPLLGDERLDGIALQLGYPWDANEKIARYLTESQEAGAPWIVSLDEVGPWWRGLDPDDAAPQNNQDSLRALALWGSLLAGGAGAEWYFGANNPHNDLNLEDWRSRDRAYRWTANARRFFEDHLPFWEMASRNDLMGEEGQFCLAKEGEIYAVMTPFGQPATLKLGPIQDTFRVRWYDPRQGGELIDHGERLTAGDDGWATLVPPGEGDWVALVELIASAD
jgi:hypothetical protein